jgi:hypothetical protein
VTAQLAAEEEVLGDIERGASSESVELVFSVGDGWGSKLRFGYPGTVNLNLPSR